MSQVDIIKNSTQQSSTYVLAGMKRNDRSSPIRMFEEYMAAFLTYFLEAEFLKYFYKFPRFKSGNLSHKKLGRGTSIS